MSDSCVEVGISPDALDDVFYFLFVLSEFSEIVAQVGEVSVILVLTGGVTGGLAGRCWFSSCC